MGSESHATGSECHASASDRVTQVRLRNARCVRDVTLSLRGLNVLIGPNGSGKSTLLEAIELLRLMGGAEFEQEFYSRHGGLTWLLRRGERALGVGIRVQGAGLPLEYDVTLGQTDAGYVVRSEHLTVGPKPGYAEPLKVIVREPHGAAQYFNQENARLEPLPELFPAKLAIHSFGLFPPNAAITRLVDALRRVSVHVPFEVRPAWTSPSDVPALRRANVVRPTDRLERFGGNLANAWHALKNDFGEQDWQETLLDVRAGLGPEVDTVATQADRGGGQVALKIRYRDGAEESAYTLSDGTLAYLAFVALHRLGRPPQTASSLLAFDEPELHLHPELLVRVLGYFEELADTQTVLLATHSDRLLDVLSTPAESVVLCDLAPDRTTRLRRPDPDQLESWLEEYRGVGRLRAEGYEASVFTRDEG